MPLGRTGNGDGKPVAVLLAHKFDQLRRVVQIAARTFPAERQVAAQRKHMIDPMLQIPVELFANALFRVADAGEVRDRNGFSVLLNLIEHRKVLANIGSACSVGAGNVVGMERVELVQHAAVAAQFFHADVRFGRKHLKGKGCSFLHNLRNAQNKDPPYTLIESARLSRK